MGGGTPRATTAGPARPDRPFHLSTPALSPALSPALPPPSPPRPFSSHLRPFPSFLRRQEPPPPSNFPPPPPIHPSPLPGGRLGGGWDAPSHHHRPCTPRSPSVTPASPPSHLRPLRHTNSPSVTPAPLSVIPAQAGTTAHPHFPKILLRSHQNRSARTCLSPRNPAAAATPPPATKHLPTLTKP